MARPILQGIGRILIGRFRNRIRSKENPPLLPIDITTRNDGPAVTRVYEPPVWLQLILDAIIYLVSRVRGSAAP